MQYKTLIFSLIFIFFGCQQVEINSTKQETLEDDSAPLDLNIQVNIEQPQYKGIWEYFVSRSIESNNYILDERVLYYMNIHLKDISKFTEYLNDSFYFFYFAIDELEKNDLPVELALVPYIESNYDPFSISPSGAVGMWQFMPRTGRFYDLDRTWWNEDRHDPFASTIAAVKYLEYLYKRFDKDIYLTLAAYNAGPSLLDRKIRQNKRKGSPTDFRSLDLPEQTKDYIPKYIALKELILNSERYEIILPDIPYEPVVTKVVIPGQVEIYALSEYLQIKPELLYKLNAGYTKWASAPKDESIFYIPVDKQELFSNNNPFDTFDQINWISHSIQEGDSLWALAKKYDTEVKIVKEINYLKSDVLTIGDDLLIPLSKTESNSFIPYELHIVSEGDTLWSISSLYNLDINDIARMNNIDPDSLLQLGQQLSIGNKNIHRNMESKKRTILYSVKQGDSLYKISELFDVSIKSIKDINEFKNSTLMPGQIIKVAIRAF